mmetsp:Transcript_39286/g.72728  ORF Transcript_39286/g.72728 Transcript_39286/m.72728 type:complete len:205 (+) Transcript_39286:6479-7093(+)
MEAFRRTNSSVTEKLCLVDCCSNSRPHNVVVVVVVEVDESRVVVVVVVVVGSVVAGVVIATGKPLEFTMNCDIRDKGGCTSVMLPNDMPAAAALAKNVLWVAEFCCCNSAALCMISALLGRPAPVRTATSYLIVCGGPRSTSTVTWEGSTERAEAIACCRPELRSCGSCCNNRCSRLAVDTPMVANTFSLCWTVRSELPPRQME